jgi:3-oxoacyl-[acyl-carrier-protein] synthase II
VTGIGVVSPLGRGTAPTWEAVRAGTSAVQRRDDGRLAALVPDELFVSPFRDGQGRPLYGRAAQLAVMAGSDALASAGLASGGTSGTIDLAVGTTMGEPTWIDTWPDEDAAQSPPPRARARELVEGTPAALTSSVVSKLEGSRLLIDAADGSAIGRSISVGGACAAGNFALAWALDEIRAERSTAIMAGGVDAFSRTALMGFAKLGALAADACRPFGKDRQGLVLGEGAAFLVIEELEHARARGAEILALLLGAGMSCDAYHPTSPHPQGVGAAQALEAALDDAGVERDDVGWVSAHGTGTPANDRSEILALHRIFEDGPGRRPPTSSVKSLTGHGLGAASAIEAVLCVLAVRARVAPPTWHVGPQDPDCDWDVILEGERPIDRDVVVDQAYAFGGCNAVTVFRAYESQR